MATNTQPSAMDQYNQTLQQVQNQYNSFKQQLQSANTWGASSGQIQTLNSSTAQWGGILQQLQGLQNTFQQIDQYGLGNDPGIQQYISQLVANPGNVQAIGALLNQSVTQNAQLASQQQQLKGLQDNLTAQDFGAPTAAESAAGKNATMSDALTNNQGALGQLNQFETGQTAQTFNQLLSPEITMALGGQGLANSGANVELQSKALAGLEMNQQQSVENAGLGMMSNLQGLQTSSTMGNIGTQQQNLSNLQQTQNFYTTMAFQQSLMNQQAQLAQSLSSFGGGGAGGGALGSLAGGGLGAIIGAFAGGPAGAAMGLGLGSSLGGNIGGSVSPGSSGYGPNASPFFAASSSLPTTFRNPFGNTSSVGGSMGSGLGAV